MTALVLDTTPISHFAACGRLDDLLELTSFADELVLTAEVLNEIARGVSAHPHLNDVFTDPRWFTSWSAAGINEITTTVTLKGELGGKPLEHLGECSTISYAQHHDAIAIVDDQDGRNLAEDLGVTVQGTLWLIVRAFKEERWTRDQCAAIVDALLGTGMWLPVQDGGGLFAWAYREGYLP